MNIFIFHRDLRLVDNTTLIKMIKEEGPVTPIFVFPPEQIDPSKNKYFSHNLVQFMIESIKELDTDIKQFTGKLYTFKGDYIDILNSIHKIKNINSIGSNYDYSPYAKKRDTKIEKWCKTNNINFYQEEDMLLHPIMTDDTFSPSTKRPYTVFTPFKKNCQKTLKVADVDKFRKFKFSNSQLTKNKYYFNDLDSLYEHNKDINVNGGRNNAIKIIKNIGKFNEYDKKRNFMTYKTTFLSAYINFNVVSIREVYHAVKSKLGNVGLVSELYWRDFYYNILYFFPHVVGNAFNAKYDKIKWDYSASQFKKWKDGKTGFPIVDACMRQLNNTGYMHNRGRMIVSSFLTKDLLIDWRKGEKYFATKLVDYNISANNGGWQWSAGSGTDAQPYFRIFNPWTQSVNYDKECEYIKKYVPELKDVEPKHIHNWYKYYDLYTNLDYPKPMVDHATARLETLNRYKKYL